MSELEKYIVATVLLFVFFGILFFLSALIPMLIERALPL